MALNFHCLELEFKSVIFWRREEEGTWKKKTLGEQQQQQTQHTYDSEFGNRTRATAVTTPSNNNQLISHMC